MRKLIWICALLALLPLNAPAEDDYELAPVEITAAPATPAAPTAVTAFSETLRPDEKQAAFETTTELLRSATGTSLKSLGGLGGYATMSLRGASANQTLILLDGQRLNAASGAGTDLSKLPLTEIERIEIIRGSDATGFGANAMGGVVNIVTQAPTAAPRLKASLMGGSFGTREMALNASGQPAEHLGLSLGLSARHADNDYEYINDAGTSLDETDDYRCRRQNNAFDDRSGLLKLDGSGDKWKLRGLANLYQAHKEIPGIVTFPTPLAEQDLRRAVFSLGGEYSFSSDLRLMTSLGRTGQDEIYRNPESATNSYASSLALDDEFKAALEFRRGGLKLTPSLGCLGESLDDLASGDHSRRTTSIGLSAEMNQGAWQLVGAGRLDRNTDFSNQRCAKLGLARYLTDQLWLMANLGTGYRLPSFSELYYNQGFFVGNTALKPEKSQSFDAGPAWEFERCGGSLAIFEHRYDDVIVYILQSGFYYKPYNISRSKARGLELSLWCEPLEDLRLSGNYTYNKAVDSTNEFNRDGNQLPGIARNVYNLAISYSRALGPVRLGGHVDYNYTEGNFLTRANTKKLDDRHVLSAGLSLAPSDKLSLRCDCKNLLDEHSVDLYGFPLEGRAYYLSLNLEF